jgi:hypothetical protein
MRKSMWLVTVLGIMFSTSFLQADALTPAQAEQVQDSLAVLCPLLGEETFLVLSIAEERKNPAGVIDIQKLHNLGEELALTRHAIKQVKTDYAAGLKLAKKMIGKTPDAGFCKSWLETAPAP